MEINELIKILNYIEEIFNSDLEIYVSCDGGWDWSVFIQGTSIHFNWDSDTIKTFEDFKKYCL